MFPLGACRCLLWATIALSQTQTTGRIPGTVKDAQGGFIPGAEVVVENNATGDKRTATTDETGSYALPLLPPDAWVVTIATRGFATARFTNVGVSLGETTPVDATLPLGGDKLRVTVNDTAPLVRSDSAEIGLALGGARSFEPAASCAQLPATPDARTRRHRIAHQQQRRRTQLAQCLRESPLDY